MRAIACVFVSVLSALLMQCAHRQPRVLPPDVEARVFTDCDDDCPEMIALPEGDVALGRFEVTLEEYRAYAEEAPDVAEPACGNARRSWRAPGYLQTGRHPVACVSWNEAMAYVEWLSTKTGREYRLPTEAEWHRGAAGVAAGCFNQGGTCPVGSFEPSGAGLFDMSGNLEEWTDDCWDGDCDRMVRRGSHWRSIGVGTFGRRSQHSDMRNWAVRDHRDFTTGFRVATSDGSAHENAPTAAGAF